MTTIEVNRVDSPRIGEVRTCDVRAMIGTLRPEMSVDVLAVSPTGGAPSVARVLLIPMGGARGGRCGFCCPHCLRPRALLVVDGKGGLACRACAQARTRRQSERSLKEWRRLGGELGDRILRLLAKPRLRTAAVLELAGEFVDELIVGDDDRLAALMPKVNAVLDMANQDL